MASSLHQPTFNCPRCGGEIEYDGHSLTQRCTYCGASSPVPQDLRPAPAIHSAPPVQYTLPARRGSNVGCTLIAGFVVVMIAVTVVLPLVTVNQALSSIPAMPSILKDMATEASSFQGEATREAPKAPTRALSPTPPAFAEVVLQFGEKGLGPGQFTNAQFSGLDGEGRIYVGEYSGGRIQVFDASGQFLRQFFVGDKDATIDGLAVDRAGVVYVSVDGDLTRWASQTGKPLGSIRYDGGPRFGELALAPDGTVYAMWYERRYGIFTSLEGAREDLVHFDADGRVIKVLPGVISSLTDNLALSNFLAVDGRGTLFIAPTHEAAIFKFDSQGKYITRLGSSGEGDSQFKDVGALAVDGQGRIFMAEAGDISVLKADGSRLSRIVTDGTARGLLFNDAGALWVTSDSRVVKYQIKQP